MKTKINEKPLKGIRSEWDVIIKEHYQLKNSLNSEPALKAVFAANPNLQGLFERLYGSIEGNLSSDPGMGITTSNWKLRREMEMDENNDSPEERLERKVVRLSKNEKSAGGKMQGYYNQMPAASGYAGRRQDIRTSIDLVHEAEPGKEYHFIELKVLYGSGHPVYAAFELLSYGFLYLLTRTNKTLREIFASGPEKPVLGAERIHLTVLAPTTYFERNRRLDLDTKNFEQSFNAALSSFSKTKVSGLEMSFEFRQFHNPVSTREEIEDFVDFDPSPCGEQLTPEV